MSHFCYQGDPKIQEIADFIGDPVKAATFPLAKLRYRNQRAAQSIGLGDLSEKEWQAHFWAFEPLPQNLPQPLALRYHGHQFLHYNPELGDGRGFLFAQLRDRRGRLLDLGTKGSGTTPYSRDGDGRLTLQGGVREVLAANLLCARGVNSSKALSLFETGEALERHDEPSPTRSAVLVRLSHSHLRIGSVQRLAYYKERGHLEALLRHLCRHYYAHFEECSPEQGLDSLAPALLKRLCESSAAMVAQWTLAGFVHGVLNTDNINLTGESFDYGPFRFLEHFDPLRVAAYFDQSGLYAFGRQAQMVAHNLGKLAECLLAVASKEDLQEALDGYQDHYAENLISMSLARLGRESAGFEADRRLASALIKFLQSTPLSMEGLFFDLFGVQPENPRVRESPRADSYRGEDFEELCTALKEHPLQALNAQQRQYFEHGEPCELTHDIVEAIWSPIHLRDDWSAFCNKLAQIDDARQAYGLEEIEA